MFAKAVAKYFSWVTIFVLLAAVVAVLLSTSAAHGAETAKWTSSLAGEADVSSPVLADVDNDGFLDVVVGTNEGHIKVVKHNGQTLWDKDISGAFGKSSNSVVIASSPAVADLNNDGTVEVVVGVGNRAGQCNGDGGVIVLSHTGDVESGWPYKTSPWENLCAVFSSPALADIDDNGDLEIIAGSFNKQVLAFHHNGQFVAGFPPNSSLAQRFPLWPQLQGRLADTMWSSPAVANTDNDRFLEIFMGADEGNFGDQYGGNSLDWFCPYNNPSTPQYCGGSIQGFDHTGQPLPNAPKWYWEHIQSTPAVADINQDGVLDIVVGTGTYYNAIVGNIPYDERILVVNSQTMKFLPGWNDVNNSDPRVEDWSGGKIVSDSTPASPAVGDIAGDSKPEVIALTMDKKLYAWFSNGSLVPGFPMTPLNHIGDGTSGDFNVGQGVILGDTDGDGKMEILLGKGGDVVIVDGNGQQLSSRGSNVPIYYAAWSISNLPAVGDIDKDGKLELVVAAQDIYVWDLPDASGKADWPMYKQNAARTSSLEISSSVLSANPGNIAGLKQNGSGGSIQRTITLKNTGDIAYNWSLSSVSSGVSINPSSGTVNAGNQVELDVTINVNNTLQDDFVVNASDDNGNPARNSPLSIDIDIIFVNQIRNVFVPLARK